MKIKFFYIFLVGIFTIALHGYSYGEMMCNADMGEGAHSDHATFNAAKETCPVSGEIVEKDTKATYKYKGKVYKFCCTACIDEFKKNPETYISPGTTTHQHSH